jgi:ribonuclease E
MQINIHIEDGSKLSERDRSVLLALAGVTVAEEDAEEAAELLDDVAEDAPEPEDEPEPEPQPTRRKRRTKAQIAADKAAEEAAAAEDDDGEDLIGNGDEGEDEGPTLDDAVSAATDLVSKGKSATVKAALKKVGAARVSELTKTSDIQKFLDALP